jgi:ubiquinone/menaquinone biosynthesis C-methylase UbiE
MDNTHRFTGRAEDYDRYRQRYPTEEILTRLREWCGLEPDWVVADIGAGTGMVAEVFLANGNRVLAVEPNRDMRDQMRASVEQHLGRPAPQLQIVDATAENTSLPAASVDMIAVGRAFHWFDQEKALAEFRRVLKSGGWIVMVALDRAREHADHQFSEQIDTWENMLSAHSADYERVRSRFRNYDYVGDLIGGEIHQAKLPGLRQLDWTAFRGHAMSLSVVPAPGQPSYEEFQHELRDFFDSRAKDGIFTMPTTCWITAARFPIP